MCYPEPSIPLQSDTLVLQTLYATCPLTLDQLVIKLPELRWNEVFHAIDLLSREGKITLRRRGFDYEIRLPAAIEPMSFSPQRRA